jgi:signal peptidase I
MSFWKQNKEEKTNPKKKKSWLREWLDAAVFAIVAATLIRLFLFEAYTIPTGSMEGSMLISDYLFVSKLAYGPRLPMTPIAIPLVHNTIPLFNTISYTDAVKWGYCRLPGFGKIERYDVVVFNFPAGDTVALEVQQDKDYYALLRENNYNRELVKNNFTVIPRPVDKEENFIKRNIGLPGDVVEVRDAIVYVNGTKAPEFPHSKLFYIVRTNGNVFSDEFLDEHKIEIHGNIGAKGIYLMNIANDKVELVKKQPNVVSVEPYLYPKQSTDDWAYPQDTANFKWNRDNYGPITIPKQGATVALTPQNISLYRRVIFNYEHNKLEEKDGKIFINGKEANSYTFKMDYYWMMGDNRDNSADSRYWGFVPIDHVVGKAWFVWFSYGKDGIFKDMRWRRMFRSIHALEQ